MAFTGWPVEAVEFYEGLEADNSKVYWQQHKAVYDRAVKAPMEELLAELAGEFGAGKIFRPYRDVRFSADKTPYKTNCSATVGDGYLALSAEEFTTASGLYMAEPAELARYRAAVDAGDRGLVRPRAVVCGGCDDRPRGLAQGLQRAARRRQARDR